MLTPVFVIATAWSQSPTAAPTYTITRRAMPSGGYPFPIAQSNCQGYDYTFCSAQNIVYCNNTDLFPFCNMTYSCNPVIAYDSGNPKSSSTHACGDGTATYNPSEYIYITANDCISNADGANVIDYYTCSTTKGIDDSTTQIAATYCAYDGQPASFLKDGETIVCNQTYSCGPLLSNACPLEVSYIDDDPNPVQTHRPTSAPVQQPTRQPTSAAPTSIPTTAVPTAPTDAPITPAPTNTPTVQPTRSKDKHSSKLTPGVIAAIVVSILVLFVVTWVVVTYCIWKHDKEAPAAPPKTNYGRVTWN